MKKVCRRIISAAVALVIAMGVGAAAATMSSQPVVMTDASYASMCQLG